MNLTTALILGLLVLAILSPSIIILVAIQFCPKVKLPTGGVYRSLLKHQWLVWVISLPVVTALSLLCHVLIRKFPDAGFNSQHFMLTWAVLNFLGLCLADRLIKRQWPIQLREKIRAASPTI